MFKRRFIISVALAASALFSGCGDDDATAANAGNAAAIESQHGVEVDDLPVTRVVLYQNGVGYFEREGRVEGDTISLRIRPDQINDILKSLTVINKGDGRAISVSLPVDRNAIDRLAQLPPQIRQEGGILSLIQAFRGARVELQTTRGTLKGRLVGSEPTERVDDNGKAITTWRVTLKQDSGELQLLTLDEISAMELEDETLALGLEKSLDISLNEGSWKPIELKVRMSDSKARDVRLSYIVEMPVWKPAYRMVLGGDEEKSEGLVQGWAVVDNVSGSDWRGVNMSLVAGTPISFVYDLYKPHFVTRPDLTNRRNHVALAPPTVESAVSTSAPKRSKNEEYERRNDNKDRMAKATGAAPGGGWGYGGGGGDGSMAAPTDEPYAEGLMADMDYGEVYEAPREMQLEDFEQGFVSNTEGKEMGALFRYDVGAKVTIPDSASSLVNIVESKGEAREIVLFPKDRLYGNVSGVHPFSAAQFTNSSGFDLEPGPISIYRGDGTFVGEGFLPRTEQDKVTFVTFAMDSRVTARTEQSESEEASRLVKLHGGVLTSEVKRVRTVTYEFSNVHSEAVTAVVQRPILAGWTLDGAPAGTLEAAGSHYIPVELAPGEKTSFTVREITPVKRQLYVNDTLTFSMLELSLANGEIEAQNKAEIQEILAKRKQIGDIDAELRELKQARDTLQADSRRLSNTLYELKDIKEGRAKKLREQLVNKIAENETAIGEKTTRIAELELDRNELDRTMRAIFTTLSIGE